MRLSGWLFSTGLGAASALSGGGGVRLPCGGGGLPLTGNGMWTAHPKINADPYFHTEVEYKLDECVTPSAGLSFNRPKPRWDAAQTSRLRWTDASGRALAAFDPALFLRRFRYSDVVVVGDSFSKSYYASLHYHLACSQPRRTWPITAHGGIIVPEANLSVTRIVTNYLQKSVDVAKSKNSSKPDFWVKDGKRVEMKSRGVETQVRLDVPGLGAWADARRFARAGLVVVQQGRWSANYRSDTRVVTKAGGALGENATAKEWNIVFADGVQRAMAWFDEILPPTSVVVWMSYTFAQGACNDVKVDERCAKRTSQSLKIVRALNERPKRWTRCGDDEGGCAARMPRQFMLDITGASACRPDSTRACVGKNENGTVTSPRS